MKQHYKSFAREFPATHPRAGQPTEFREKMARGEKTVTIRPMPVRGIRAGDIIQPFSWSGTRSTQEKWGELYRVVDVREVYIMRTKIVFWLEYGFGDGRKDRYQKEMPYNSPLFPQFCEAGGLSETDWYGWFAPFSLFDNRDYSERQMITFERITKENAVL